MVPWCHCHEPACCARGVPSLDIFFLPILSAIRDLTPSPCDLSGRSVANGQVSTIHLTYGRDIYLWERKQSLPTLSLRGLTVYLIICLSAASCADLQYPLQTLQRGGCPPGFLEREP